MASKSCKATLPIFPASPERRRLRLSTRLHYSTLPIFRTAVIRRALSASTKRAKSGAS